MGWWHFLPSCRAVCGWSALSHFSHCICSSPALRPPAVASASTPTGARCIQSLGQCWETCLLSHPSGRVSHPQVSSHTPNSRICRWATLRRESGSLTVEPGLSSKQTNVSHRKKQNLKAAKKAAGGGQGLHSTTLFWGLVISSK